MIRWGYYRLLSTDETGAPRTAERVAIYDGDGGFVGAWHMLPQLRHRLRQRGVNGVFFVGTIPSDARVEGFKEAA